MSASNTVKLFSLAGEIKKSIDAPLLRDVDLLPDAVVHFTRICYSFKTATSDRLFRYVQLYKQHLDEAIEQHKQQRDFEHLYNYILDVAHKLNVGDNEETMADVLVMYEKDLQDCLKKQRRVKNSNSLAKKQTRLRELAIQHGLRAVGRTDESPDDVYCYDAVSGQQLDLGTMLIKDIDDVGDSGVDEATDVKTPDPAVPLPSTHNPFPPGFVTTAMVNEQGFRTLREKTVYGFARAPNGMYAMVFAVQFSSPESLTPVERKAVDVLADYVPKAVEHGYRVKCNKAQNAGDEHHGGLFSSGWRPGQTAGESYGEYCKRSGHHPDGYADLYEKQPVVNVAWIVLQEGLSPRAVHQTIDALSDIAVPLFGSHDVNIENHGPSLGLNMAVLKHDAHGRNFANGMHTDRDIDSLPEYYGKPFTFGLWFHTNSAGQLVDGNCIKDAIPEGLFILPGYRIAFDLGAAAVVRAIWRGGMDLHGTTTSTVALDKGITRWGMSIQTNRGLVQRLRSGKGKIFGVHERIKQYYNALT